MLTTGHCLAGGGVTTDAALANACALSISDSSTCIDAVAERDEETPNVSLMRKKVFCPEGDAMPGWRLEEGAKAANVPLWRYITVSIPRIRIHTYIRTYTAEKKQAGTVSTSPGFCDRQGTSWTHPPGYHDYCWIMLLWNIAHSGYTIYG